MKMIVFLGLAGAFGSIFLALIARLSQSPIFILPLGVEASTFLKFANTCLLVVIALTLLELLKIKSTEKKG
jgi:hypothetical protein